MSEPVAIYCVADERYFLGAVGLVNSLRLAGHAEPIYLLDRGLTGEQRRRLAAQAELIDGPRDMPPWLSKTIAPRAHPAEVAVLIDADMVVTRSLAPLIDTARSGRVVAALNDADRFVERWGELLELGSIQRRPYVSSGLVLLGGEEGAEVLELLDDRQRLADVARGYYGANDSSYPFLYPEQDVLNAILCSRPKGELTVRLPHRLAPAPPYPGLRVLDAGERRCAYDDGTEPFLLHQIVRKPWLEPAYHGPYSRLLARVLLADDAPVPVAADELPLRMRDGLVALLERKRVDALDLLRWYGLERLPRWLARRSRTVRGTRRHTP